MADVFVRHRRSQTRSRERHLGEIPLSTGEIEYFTRQDEAARRRQRLLQVREQEKRAAQLVTQRYRDNLRKLQSYKLQLAQRDHRHQQETVLSALHEKYQYSVQGMGTAQRNAREKMIELMELAQLEQDKWSLNRRGEKLRFHDAVGAVQEDVSVRLARRREIDRNLKRLKEMSLKHRSEASARAQRELEQELKLQKAQEDAQRYREYHLETEEFSFPRKTPKDVTAFQFTRTHCVAVPGTAPRVGDGSRTVDGSAERAVREVKVVRHNRNTQQTTTSAIDQAEVYRKEMELRQETEWRMREQQARVAGSRGEDALHTVESIQDGSRALEWLVEMERQARVEKVAQLDGEGVKTESHRDKAVNADDSGSAEFAQMFGIEEGREGLLDESFGERAAQRDGHPERIAARRAGSVSASDDSWLLDDEWRTPSERFGSEELDAPPVERGPAEKMVDQKIEAMNELLKRVASYGDTQSRRREDGEARERADDAHINIDASNFQSSRQRYAGEKEAQAQGGRQSVRSEFSEGDGGPQDDTFSEGGHGVRDDTVHPSRDPLHLRRDSVLGRGHEEIIDTSAHQDLGSIRAAIESVGAPFESTQARGMPTQDRGENDDAIEFAVSDARSNEYHARDATTRRGSLVSPHSGRPNNRNRRGEQRPQSNWKELAASTAMVREEQFEGYDYERESAASGRRKQSLRVDVGNSSNHRDKVRSRTNRPQEEGSTDISRRDHEDHQYGDYGRDSTSTSRGSDVESYEEPLDELEDRLRQVLEERRSTPPDRTSPIEQAGHPRSAGESVAFPVERGSTRDGRWYRRDGGEQSDVSSVASQKRTASDPRELHRSVVDKLGGHGSAYEDSSATSSLAASGARYGGRPECVASPNSSMGGVGRESVHQDGGVDSESPRHHYSRHNNETAQSNKDTRRASLSSTSRSQRAQGGTGENIDSSRTDLPREDTPGEFSDEGKSSVNRSIDEAESERSRDDLPVERVLRSRQPSQSRQQQPGSVLLEAAASASDASDGEDRLHSAHARMPAQGGNEESADNRGKDGDKGVSPATVVALDESADASDFDLSMLRADEHLHQGGITTYLRQMEQEGAALQSSSSSFPQYSLPLSDSFSSMNDSIIEADGGVASLTNQLLPMFPQHVRRSSDVSATTDEAGVRRTSGARGTQGGPARGETGLLLKGLMQQDDEVSTTEVAPSGPTNPRAEGTQTRTTLQEDPRRPSRQRVSDQEPPRGPLHDLSFSSDSSSDMSAFIYLTRMRKVTSTSTPGSRRGETEAGHVVASSSESLSGLSSLSSTPVHPSMAASREANKEALSGDKRRDSVGSSVSSTASIDARFQYLVNMTAVAGKALPLHMNLPPRDLHRSDMRFPPPQVNLNVYSSDSDEDDSNSAAQENHSKGPRHTLGDFREPTTDPESALRVQDTRDASAHTQYPLPAAPFGQFDLSNPPAPAFGSSSASSSSASEVSARRSDNRSERGSSHSDRSRSDDVPVQQFALEELSQRLAGLPPSPYSNFDMSQPPDPLGWGFDAQENDDGSSVSGSERRMDNGIRDDPSQDGTRSSARRQSIGASPKKKGEALFVPLETDATSTQASGTSLADLFRQRHPRFHQRAQEANKSLLEQRREQLAARRAEVTAPNSGPQQQKPLTQAKPKAPPSPPRSRTPSTMSMPPPALLDRLAAGERAKISTQEMKDRTRRLYRQLPEVAEKKRQEEVLERRRQRLAEMREREKLRRQQQKQRQR